MTQASAVSRKATLLPLTFMIYGAVCAGAFGLEDMVSSAGPGAALLTLIVMPFIFCLPVAYAVGELTCAFPIEGGNYRWSRMAFGDFWGFQAGWWAWMASVLSNSMFAVLFASYLQHWIPGLTGVWHWLVCLSLIWSMYYLNLRGIELVGSSSILLSLVLLAPFAVMVVLGIAQWGHNPFSPFAAPPQSVWGGIGSAVVLGIWLYSGFDKLSTVAEEVESPQRNFPPALLFAASLTMLSYVLPTLAGLAAKGDWQSWSGTYFPTVAGQIGGPWLGAAMLFGALCSNALLLNVCMLSASRVLLSMAQDDFMPGFLARPHPRLGTPGRALLAGSAVYSLFSLLDFKDLMIIYAWFQMSSYVLLYVNVWALRRTHAAAPRPFKIPFGAPGFFVSLGLTGTLALAAVGSSVYKDGRFLPLQAGIGVLAFLSGPAAYWITRGRRSPTLRGLGSGLGGRSAAARSEAVQLELSLDFPQHEPDPLDRGERELLLSGESRQPELPTKG